MQYDLAIFDLDGTILDTLEDLYTSLNHALSSAGLPGRSMEETRQFVGNGIRRLIERAVPGGSDAALVDSVHAAFTAHYKLHCADHTRPYDGITALLQALRAEGMRTAVVSNKADYAVQALCTQYFPGLFDAVAGEREGIRRKPAPDAVLAVLDALDTPRERAVYIGDSDVDVLTANAAGLDGIAVLWGFRDEQCLRQAGAVRFADTPQALLAALR